MVRVDIFGIAVFLFFLPQFSSFGASKRSVLCRYRKPTLINFNVKRDYIIPLLCTSVLKKVYNETFTKDTPCSV